MIPLGRLLERVRRSTFAQAVRVAHAWARREAIAAEVGRDELPAAEPVRFYASDRMGLPVNDIAGAEAGDRQLRVISNVMGLAGTTPALPPPYSELLLQRRRARDFALSHFLAIFDHRALSFFWRIAEKYSWPLMAERAGRGSEDPIQRALVTLAGVGQEGARERLDLRDRSLVRLVAQLADVRRSAASVETVLQVLTGLPLRIVQATPTWMAIPASEQTRIGGQKAQFAQLGQMPGESETGVGEAAMIGAAVLDAQHHYVVEIGPLGYRELQDFCCRPSARRAVSQLCALAAGIEQRPSMRLLIRTSDIPGLRLGEPEAPAMLGRTTWLGAPARSDGVAGDCLIPIDPTAMTAESIE